MTKQEATGRPTTALGSGRAKRYNAVLCDTCCVQERSHEDRRRRQVAPEQQRQTGQLASILASLKAWNSLGERADGAVAASAGGRVLAKTVAPTATAAAATREREAVRR